MIKPSIHVESEVDTEARATSGSTVSCARCIARLSRHDNESERAHSTQMHHRLTPEGVGTVTLYACQFDFPSAN